ncbi:MAG: hypothetical protein ABI338_07470 [Gemmatimonadaceae bacterium]
METTRPLARAGYLMAALLVVLPLFDAITRFIPMQLGDQKWRFQAAGNFSNATLVPLIGLLIALAFTFYADDPRTRRFVGIVCIVFAVAVLALAGTFATDYFGVRAEIPPRLQHGVALASLAAFCKEILAIIVLLLLAAGSLRARVALPAVVPARVRH